MACKNSKEFVVAFLKADNVRITFQYHFYNSPISNVIVVSFEPHIISHYPQIAEFLYYGEPLQIAIKVFEVSELRIKLINKLFLCHP